jgi:hypothetical protein
MRNRMDVVIFPNARNVGVIPPVNMYTSEHIQVTIKDMDNILKYHKKNKDKITNIVFRYGDPMDNGVEFYLHLLEVLDSNPQYANTRITIETPFIAFLKRFGTWQKVVEHDRVLVKAVFDYGEKEASGRFFSDSDLMAAYSRFWNSFRYRPALIYYKSEKNIKYARHMERLSFLLKTTLETRDISNASWTKETVFYSNDSYRYMTPHVWFVDNPSKYEMNSDAEKYSISKKRDEVETKLKERKEKAERQAAFRKKEDEREEATLRAIRLAKEMDKYKENQAKKEVQKKKEIAKKVREKKAEKKVTKPAPKPRSEFTPEQKAQLHAIRGKTVAKLNGEVVKGAKVDLFDAIARHRAMNNLGC